MKAVARRALEPNVWNAFVQRHDGGWFWHTTAWLDYCLAYTPGSIDHSFAVVQDGHVVGICPMIQEGAELAAGGDPLPWPIDQEPSCFIENAMSDILKSSGCRRIRLRKSPLADTRNHEDMPDGWKDITWLSQVIDLTPPLETIWRDVSKGHRAAIHKGLRDYDISADPGALRRFMDLHYAQHTTMRPWATWELMEDWLETQASLYVAREADDIVGGVYVIQYADAAYYASAAFPYEDVSVSHAVLWYAIRDLQWQGVTQFELGWLTYADVFKKGFGGESRPVIAWEHTWVR